MERGDPAAVPLLRDLLRATGAPLGRLHTLWTLRGLGALGVDEIQSALADPLAGVRENGLVLVEAHLRESAELRSAVAAMTDDPDARVRMQVALALGGTSGPQTREGLQAILRRDAERRWTRYAALAGLGDGAGDVVRSLLAPEAIGQNTPEQTAGLLDAVRHLGAVSVATGEAADLQALVRLAGRPGLANPWRAALLDGLADGLQRAETTPVAAATVSRDLAGLLATDATPVVRAALRVASSIGVADFAALDRALDRARSRAVNGDLPMEARVEEIALLALGTYARVGETLLELMELQSPPELQVAAARALARLDDELRGVEALLRWRRYGAEVKGVVLDMLLRNLAFHELLVGALEASDLSVGELNLDLEQRRRLLRRSTDDIQARAAALFGDHEFSNRQAVVDQWLPEVVDRRGNAQRGAEHFRSLCAPCHFFRGVGYSAGPDLGMAFAKGKEDLLTSILDPSAATAPEYANYLVETVDGELLNGIISGETASSVTLARANGETDTVFRSRIRDIRTEGRSLMPDGLEQGLDARDLADLLAYLQQHAH